MAYQPSGSKSINSVGTTVREKHKRYFEDHGNLCSACTIFFEQLIAQLSVLKHTDSDIVLLGDFNEYVYSGRISKHLSQPDLMFSKQCLQCTSIHFPPHSGMAQSPLMQSLPLPELNASKRTSFLTKEAWEITDASLSISHCHLLLELSFPTSSGALHESYAANLPIWYSLIMPSWTCSAINTRCTKGYTSFTHTSIST